MSIRSRIIPLVLGAVIALGLLIGVSAANAGAVPVMHKSVKCATYYIEVPDVNPPPVHLSPDTQPLIFFKFCGTTVVPGTYTCPVKSGQQIIDRPVGCTKRK